MKIAVITDTHFGVRNDNLVMAKNMETFYRDVFFPTIDKYKIDTVIHCGDVTDRRKYINFMTMQWMRKIFFEPLFDRGVMTYTLLGNHDVYYRNTNSINSMEQIYGHVDMLDLLQIVRDEPLELEFDSTKVILVPWINTENQDDIMASISKTKAQVLFGHLELAGFEMMRGQYSHSGMDKKVFDKFDCVYSGHFHHPSNSGNISYLGAPYEMNWSDHGGKRGFHIFDTEDRSMTHIPNKNGIFQKIFYDDTEMTVEDLQDLQFQNLKNCYVKIVVETKTNPYIFDLFMDQISGCGAADVRVVEAHGNMDQIDESDLIDEAKDTLTILQEYVETVKIQSDKDMVIACLSDLYKEALDC